MFVRRALELGPGTAEEWTNLGCVFVDHFNEPLAGLSCFEMAIKLDPDLGQPRQNVWYAGRAVIEDKLLHGRHDDALPTIERVMGAGEGYGIDESHGFWSFAGMCFARSPSPTSSSTSRDRSWRRPFGTPE